MATAVRTGLLAVTCTPAVALPVSAGRWVFCPLLARMGKEINALLYGQGDLHILAALPSAGIAQLVEQRIRNAWVGSSNLFTGTISLLVKSNT